MSTHQLSRELMDFIQKSPSMFHAVHNISKMLDEAGATCLQESSKWTLKPGHTYYTTRNNSSIIAFQIPEEMKDYHFQMISSHSDSPTFKIKSVPELTGPGEYLKLNVEAYGGMIDNTWFDRPLTVAGRILVNTDKGLESRLFSIDQDILLIPNEPIHFDRTVNDGKKLNRQIDLCPLYSNGEMKKGSFNAMVAEVAGVKEEDLLGKDLFLVNREQPVLWGWKKEFISTPKLDDLECAFCTLKGFLDSLQNNASGHINVYCCFDNEEVGSNTKQGAMSTFLADTLDRINEELGKTGSEYHQAVAKSFMVSADNAHAVHPNHPEKFDDQNRSWMNKGIVIKEAANQKYTTDAFSRAVFTKICQKAGVPVQTFANRSDIQGGSTLGNLSNTQVSVHAVDIGLPQLAMHSSYETGGTKDVDDLKKASETFFTTEILIEGASQVSFS